MPSLTDIRQSYPQYNDMPDAALADALYKKFYSDMPRAEFDAKIGLQEKPQQPGFTDKLAKAWENPPAGPSLIGMAKAVTGFVGDAADAAKGESKILPPGLRREDFTDIPHDPGPSQAWVGSRLGMRAGSFGTQPNDPAIESAMAGAGLIGSGTLAGAPAGAVGSGMVRRGPSITVEPTAAKSLPLLEAAERQGVPIPHFLASEDMLTQRLAAGLKNVPGAGDTIVKATKNTVDALGDATKRVEQGFGTGSAEVAGGSAKDALAHWITEGAGQIDKRLYGKVDPLVNPDVSRPLHATRQAVSEIMARRANSQITGTSPAVDLVSDALKSNAGLNYEGVKGLRTFLGDMTPEEMVAKGVNKKEADRLYSALTEDLKGTILDAGGPKALTAFEKANTVHAQIMDRKKALAKVIGTKGDASPEAVFARLVAMAGSKSSADMTRLLQARKVMGTEAWNEVASGVISRLGRDAQGNFSPDRFFTAYGNISPNAKNLLFKTSSNNGHATALNDINMIVNAHKQKIAQFGNPSGTAQNLIGASMLGTVFGDPTQLLKSLAGLGGGNFLAMALSKPAGAKAVANLMKAQQRVARDPSPAARAALQAAEMNILNLIEAGRD